MSNAMELFAEYFAAFIRSLPQGEHYFIVTDQDKMERFRCSGQTDQTTSLTAERLKTNLSSLHLMDPEDGNIRILVSSMTSTDPEGFSEIRVYHWDGKMLEFRGVPLEEMEQVSADMTDIHTVADFERRCRIIPSGPWATVDDGRLR